MGHKARAERTCINCREKAAKGELFRILRTPAGEVIFDGTGKANGRGAYVCSLACFDGAVESGKLSRALRVKLTDETRRIREDLSNADPAEVV